MAFYIDDSDTNRVVIIQGGQYTFEGRLLVTTGEDPQDPDGFPGISTEPSVTVYDPDGTPKSVGVGTRVSQGVYTYLFTCPLGAILSDKWYVQFGATIEGTFHIWRQYFKVVDRTAAEPKAQDPNQLSSLKTEEYVLAIAKRDERVYLECRVGSDLVSPLATPTLNVMTEGGDILLTPVASSVSGQDGVYYADIPGTTIKDPDTYYMLVWSYQLSVGSPTRTAIQTLWTAPLSVFKALPDLRNLLDKSQKRTDRVQGFSDQELARYIRMGLGMFNSKPPITGFSLTSLPADAYPWMLTCSMLWGLQAQILEEIDQEFEVNGQTISMRWDHVTNLSAFAQQVAQQWQDQGEKVKIPLGLGGGRLLIRPVVQGYIGLARNQTQEGTFFAAYKI